MKTLRKVMNDDAVLAIIEGYLIKGVVIAIAMLLLASSLISLF